MEQRFHLYWTQVSGYLAACVSALAQRSDATARLVARSATAGLGNAGFGDDVASGLEVELLAPGEPVPRFAGGAGDVVVVSGWGDPQLRAVAREAKASGAHVLMAMDTPYTTVAAAWLRRTNLRVRRRSFAHALDGILVPGTRGEVLAEALGFSADQIFTGCYGWDRDLFEGAREQVAARGPDHVPSGFLYAGQYHPVKGLDLLLEAYSLYRQLVVRPWTLTCMGRGPLAGAVAAAGSIGVVDLGFVQPRDQPAVFAEQDVLVLPSRRDAWGVVLAEAAGVGLPVLCTRSCGAAADVVVHTYNGYVAAAPTVDEILQGLVWMHDRPGLVRSMTGRGVGLAAPYAASAWAANMVEVGRRLRARGRDQR